MMKFICLTAFLALSSPLLAFEDVQTNAALPDNKQIWPLPKLDMLTVISVTADFSEQKGLCSYTQGNWRTEMYLVVYTVSESSKEFPDKRISFIAEDKWPAKGSGIKVKKLNWPFREGTLMFFLQRDTQCDYTNFFKILSYNEKS